MNFRKISIVAGIAILIFGYIAMKQIANSKQPPKRKAQTSQKRMVLAQKVQNQDISVLVDINGKLTATNRIELFAEVSGKLKPTQKNFKTGSSYSQGETLIAIDDSEFKLNLFAAKSNFLNVLTQLLPDIKLDYSVDFSAWKTYVDQFQIEKPIADLPEIKSDKLKGFISSKNIFNSFYQLKSQQERLSKYNITAPFNGVVAQSTINEGTLVRANQKLGEFINPNIYEIESAIRINDLDFISIGDSVELTSEDIPGIWLGKVIRISKNINPSTQTFSVYTQVSHPELKEGMFVNGTIKGKKVKSVFALDRRLLLNNNSVYVIKDSALVTKQIEIEKYTTSGVLIKGLMNDEMILKEAISGAYEGLKVEPVI